MTTDTAALPSILPASAAARDTLRVPERNVARQPPGPRADARMPVVVGIAAPVLLHGLGAIVGEQGHLRLAGSTRSLADFLAQCAQAGACVGLVDPFIEAAADAQASAVPVQSLAAFMRLLKTAAPRMRPILMIDQPLPAVVRAGLQGGAHGFISGIDDVQSVRAALVAVAAGQRYLSASIAEQLSIAMTIEELTVREMDVLRLLSRGRCNKIIARELDIAYGTVKSHLRAIMGKLDTNTRTETLMKASGLGLVHL